MKTVRFKTPSGKELMANMPDHCPDEIEITETQFDEAQGQIDLVPLVITTSLKTALGKRQLSEAIMNGVEKRMFTERPSLFQGNEEE